MARMTLQLADDYILLEEIKETQTGAGLHVPFGDPRAGFRFGRVLAMGPGELRTQPIYLPPTSAVPLSELVVTRAEMPCKVGDMVITSPGAGARYKHEGEEYWLVYGGRKDIIGVVVEAPPLVATDTHSMCADL